MKRFEKIKEKLDEVLSNIHADEIITQIEQDEKESYYMEFYQKPKEEYKLTTKIDINDSEQYVSNIKIKMTRNLNNENMICVKGGEQQWKNQKKLSVA